MLVAYKAYKDAPQWIKEKQNAEGFNHATEIMKDYDSLVLNLKPLYYNLISNDDIDNKSLKISEQIGYIFSLESRIKSCVRWRIDPSPELYDRIGEIKNYYTTALKLIGSYRMTDYIKIDELRESLTVQKNSILKNHDLYNRDIKYFFTFLN
jgi:hypothetical protein